MRPNPYSTIKTNANKGMQKDVGKMKMHGKHRIEPNQIYLEAQSSDEDEENAF